MKLQSGRNAKKLDSFSENRSIYRLDKHAQDSPRQKALERRDSDSNSVEKLFKNMRIQDRSEILDKIHNMRMNAMDKRGYEDLAKPHLPQISTNEKEKIVEQYFAAKKSLNSASVA